MNNFSQGIFVHNVMKHVFVHCDYSEKHSLFCTIGPQGNCGEQLPSTDSRPTVCRQLADTKPTGHQQVTNRLATGSEVTLLVHFCTQKSM